MIRPIFHFFFGLLLLAPVTASAMDNGTTPLTVRDAVEQALANNLNLMLQKENVKAAAGAVGIAGSRFDKFITGEADVARSERTPIFPGSAEVEEDANLDISLIKRFTTGTEVQLGWNNNRFDTDLDEQTLSPMFSSGLSLGLTQPLLRGWGQEIQLAPVQAAERDLEAETFQVNSLAADLAAQVKSGYWTLVFARQDIEVKQFSLTLAEKLLEETKAKIAAGKLAPVELFQPQSEVALREEQLIAAERAIGVADDELKLLLNSDDWYSSYTPVDTPNTEPVSLTAEIILDNALNNRPDIKAAQIDVDAARLREKVAQDDLRPELDLVGSLGYGGTDDSYGSAVDNSFDDGDAQWLVGLNLTFPLDNSAAEGAMQQARAFHSQARTSLELLKLQVIREVRTTVRDVRLAIKAIEATRKTSLATRKRLEAEQAKFDAGRSTTLDVLIAQEAYSNALSQENQTHVIYAQALAELDRIQGLISFDHEEGRTN
ncbi:TolC family protein [Desulfosediminicola ganghwensis]|uniref:TolC family protein n=1 Tax=Desulfosediminicola ganghwensis TaxID=2569540 RepID=UPI0010AD8E7B|nr:TolC family protein [Desulfosediminicola ganghwensis]